MEWLITGIIVLACAGDVLLTHHYKNSMEKYQKEMQRSNQNITNLLDRAISYFKEASTTKIIVPKSKGKE